MFVLHKAFNDTIEINGEVYDINAAYDTILTVLEVWGDEEYTDFIKAGVALSLLIGDRMDGLHPRDRIELAIEIMGKYVEFEENDKYVQDLLGNWMEAPPKPEQERLMSIKYDADKIFASFWQAYQIDLIEQQGKLHWNKFKMLMDYLPDDTPLKQAMYIRGWKPSDDKKKKKQAMREAKKKLALPEE